MEVKKYSWGERANGRTGSVVQSLMNRQLGLPCYTRGAESVSSFRNEAVIGRQLMMGRTPGANRYEMPMILRFGKKSGLLKSNGKRMATDGFDFDRFSTGWVRVQLKDKCKLTLVNGIFWANESITNNPMRRRDNIDSFYVLPPDLRRGFKPRGEQTPWYTGKLAAHDELYEGVRLTDVKTRQSNYLVILSENGYVRVCDLIHGQNAEVSLKSSIPDTVRFTQLSVDNRTEEIRVLATCNGKTKTVYVLKYLNDVNQLRIDFVIHLSFPVKMDIIESMVILGVSNHVDISTWNSLLSSAEPTPLKIHATQDLYSVCADLHEYVVKQPPQVLRRLKTQNSYLGFSTSLWPPQFYAKNAKGSNITTEIAHLSTEEMIWYITSCPVNDATFTDFPDDSPRFLFCEEEQYMVITLKRNSDGSVVVDGDSSFYPFSTQEEEVQNTIQRSGTRRTLQRAAARKTVKPVDLKALEILGLEYCSDLGLIAVGSVRDEDGGCVRISLYEAKDLALVKTLPPLIAWPQNMGKSDQSRSAKGRYSMRNFTMSFNIDVLSINMGYDNSIEEFYFLQLL